MGEGSRWPAMVTEVLPVPDDRRFTLDHTYNVMVVWLLDYDISAVVSERPSVSNSVGSQMKYALCVCHGVTSLGAD